MIRIRKQKKQKSKQFSKEIINVIKRFESRFFSIDTSEDLVDVALLSDFNWVNGKGDEYEVIQFSENNKNKRNVTRSSKFNKWKKALEEKFKIKIEFYEEYSDKERTSKSGNKTHIEKIYKGLKADIYFAG